MGKIFYSEEDIKNIISKREMNSVQILEIKRGDNSVMVRVGNNGSWVKYEIDELTKLLFPNKDVVAETEDGGLMVAPKSEN